MKPWTTQDWFDRRNDPPYDVYTCRVCGYQFKIIAKYATTPQQEAAEQISEKEYADSKDTRFAIFKAISEYERVSGKSVTGINIPRINRPETAVHGQIDGVNISLVTDDGIPEDTAEEQDMPVDKQTPGIAPLPKQRTCAVCGDTVSKVTDIYISQTANLRHSAMKDLREMRATTNPCETTGEQPAEILTFRMAVCPHCELEWSRAMQFWWNSQQGRA